MIDDRLWRTERATRMAVIVDADEYFRVARRALLSAKRRVMLIGWDFDARINLGRDTPDDGPETVGKFLPWLVERTPELEIYLLRWDMGALKSLVRGTTLLNLLGWFRHPRLHARLDGFHPAAASHHQKIVVIDDCLAFCGGIDMTGDRWDTRAHRDGEPGRHKPNGKAYPPWHDATTCLQGPVAAALGELARDRWALAGGGELDPVGGIGDCWPDDLGIHFHDTPVGIARTYPEMPDRPGIREIEALFVDQIGRAKRHIYAESQYFASRRIAEAIAGRLGDPDGPEFVLVNPLTAQGWLEPVAMDTARARLITALRRRDTHGKLRMYHPYTAGGEPIYVHAKILVVDGQELRIGSANMNNRSQGLDSECDVIVAAEGDREREAQIRKIRDGLIAEHLGRPDDEVAAMIDETDSLIATIEAMRGTGRSLRPYEVPDLSDVEKWLADNEVLDPEGPGAGDEGMIRRRLIDRIVDAPRGMLSRRRS